MRRKARSIRCSDEEWRLIEARADAYGRAHGGRPMEVSSYLRELGLSGGEPVADPLVASSLSTAMKTLHHINECAERVSKQLHRLHGRD